METTHHGFALAMNQPESVLTGNVIRGLHERADSERNIAMIEAMEQLERAYQCWCRWHNPMSRRWLRECIMEYRIVCIIR